MRKLPKVPFISLRNLAQETKQRYVALFLLVIMLVGIFVPAASAYASAHPVQKDDSAAKMHRNKLPADANKPMKQNYPGAEQPTVASAKAASDTKAVNTIAALGQKQVPVGEPLQNVAEKPKITPHELTDKRTATTSASVNADGSITQKQFFNPQFYKKDGKWVDIDTSLVEDKNAGDSGNLFGQALGQVQSWVSSATNFEVKGNDWQARFSPSDASWGMVRIKKGNSQIGFAPINAKKVAPVITTSKDGRQVVHYYDLWPGVNVEYVVESDAVKENIILKDKNATTSAAFKIIGANLVKQRVGEHMADSYVIKGALDDEFAIAPANLILNEFGFVTDQGVLSQNYDKGVLTVSVNKSYVQGLPDKAFPAVIDPTTFYSNFGTRGGGNFVSFKSDGYICYSNVCNLYAGSLYDSNWYLRWWRGAFFAPYDQFRNSSNTLMSATLHLLQRSNESFWTGDWGTHNYQVGHATCLNNFNCVDGVWASGNVAGSGDIDVTNLYRAMIANGDFGAWLMVMGEDGATNSFKNLDPGNGYTSGSYVAFTYGGPPTAPAVVTPTNGQVFVDPQPSFRVNAIPTNPNGNAPLQYEMLVSSGVGATGGLITSGLLNASQWTVPDGILQDGSTYYMQARSYDPITGTYSGWGVSVPFRIDMRTGKDKTQTFDTLGPVDVDLATGNVATSASSHTSSALGGSLGISLDYNTPLKSRNGLVGEYWNNTSMSGSPLLTRVDQNVDFTWDLGSPSGSIPADNFSARWTGYFVAPTTGDYYFGGNNDDSMSVTVNGQTAYTNGGCWPGPCYGGPAIHLNAGQIVPFQANYVELTWYATARLFVKGPVSEQVIPQEWLRTGVRPVNQSQGLTGRYYIDADGSHTFSANNPMFMQRTDALVSFDWGVGSPVANGPVDNFLVRWKGYVTVPVSGTYQFGAASDDGVRIKIGASDTLIYDQWYDRGLTETYGNGYYLTANQPTLITVEYYEHGGGASMYFKVQNPDGSRQVVPNSWLSPNARVLPDGWSLGVDPDGNLGYDHIKVNQNSVVLTDSTGDTHEYTYANGGYKPPVNEDGQLVRNMDGTFTFQDTDGRTYIFAADGTLSSVTNPVDDRKPAALQYQYQSISNGPAVIKYIKDGVDPSRMATVYYSGESSCGAAPAGYDVNAPSGMLCATITNDGRATYFYYKDGQLARIARPGNELTDYFYEAVTNSSNVTIGYRLVGVRDVLADDAIAAGVRANDDTTKTQLTYDVLGRVTSVTQPAAIAGANRAQHTIEYLPGALDKSYYGLTKQHLVGDAEPNGFTRQVKYDYLFRTMEETDAANLTSKTEWEPTKDLVYSTTDAADLKSTTIYDSEDRPTDSYGPAPSSYYGPDRKPTSTYVSQVPHNSTAYDENISGAAVSWHNVKYNVAGTGTLTLSGAPKLHTTGFATPQGLMNPTVSKITADAGYDGVGTSATGKLRLPSTGTYTFQIPHYGSLRMWIDDQLLIDQWNRTADQAIGNSTTFTETTANTPHRFRLDYAGSNNPAAFGFDAWIKGPSIPEPNPGYGTHDWASYLSPDYSLTTSTKTYDSTLGDSTTTTNYGANPELGLVQSATADPTGLNLTTANTYETQGAAGSFLRQTAKYLPGANTAVASTGTQYTHYAATDTRDNPCTTGTVEAYKQAGFMKLKTEPDPDGTGPKTSRVSETIYDDAGKIVATRYNSESSWTCTAYDARERTLTTTVPSYGSEPGRTVTNNYALSGNPLTASSSDSTGAIVTTVDLLGRTISYTDAYDDTTTSTYDSQGHLVSRTGPLGTEVFTYDSYDRLVDQKLDGVTYAHVAYDQYGRIDHVDYPDAGQAKLTIARDALGRQNSLAYTPGTSSLSPGDLLLNPSFEQHADGDTTRPFAWNQGPWGNNNAAFSYVSDAHSGTHALKVEITSYTDGDAKWYTGDPIAVTPGASYTYRNYYKSNTASRVVVEYTHQNGSVNYVQVGSFAANSNWTQAQMTFTVPSDVVKVSPMHLISSVGYLTIDDVELFRSNQGAVGSTAAASDTVTRSQSGQILSDVVASGANSITSNYTYDTVGRLTGATVGSHTYSYGFGAQSASCGTANNMNPNSGKNSNRTSQTIDGVTTTYCYDYADRLISSSDASANGALYDARGGMTQIGTGSSPLYMGYDSSGRNWGFEQYDGNGNGKGMYYDRDVQGRIIGRYSDNISNWDWTGNGMWFYDFTGAGDTPDYVRDANWDIVEKYLELPGGVVVTIKPRQAKLTDRAIYNVPNIHGDVILTLNALGANVSNGNGPAGAFVYDPFGNTVAGSVLPANADMASYAYVGQHEKLTETNFTLTPIQMGVRVYFPTLGRFASVDPVEGGTPNNYIYPLDPVNEKDLTGMCPMCLALIPLIPSIVAAAYQATPYIVRAATYAPAIAQRAQAAAPAVVKAASWAKSTLQNGNNFIRIGKASNGINRASLGPAYNHYQRLSRIAKALSPIHIHVDRKYGGVDFNWFTKINKAGKVVPRQWKWWGK